MPLFRQRGVGATAAASAASTFDAAKPLRSVVHAASLEGLVEAVSSPTNPGIIDSVSLSASGLCRCGAGGEELHSVQVLIRAGQSDAGILDVSCVSTDGRTLLARTTGRGAPRMASMRTRGIDDDETSSSAPSSPSESDSGSESSGDETASSFEAAVSAFAERAAAALARSNRRSSLRASFSRWRVSAARSRAASQEQRAREAAERSLQAEKAAEEDSQKALALGRALSSVLSGSRAEGSTRIPAPLGGGGGATSGSSGVGVLGGLSSSGLYGTRADEAGSLIRDLRGTRLASVLRAHFPAATAAPATESATAPRSALSPPASEGANTLRIEGGRGKGATAAAASPALPPVAPSGSEWASREKVSALHGEQQQEKAKEATTTTAKAVGGGIGGGLRIQQRLQRRQQQRKQREHRQELQQQQQQQQKRTLRRPAGRGNVALIPSSRSPYDLVSEDEEGEAEEQSESERGEEQRQRHSWRPVDDSPEPTTTLPWKRRQSAAAAAPPPAGVGRRGALEAAFARLEASRGQRKEDGSRLGVGGGGGAGAPTAVAAEEEEEGVDVAAATSAPIPSLPFLNASSEGAGPLPPHHGYGIPAATAAALAASRAKGDDDDACSLFAPPSTVGGDFC